MIKYNTIGDGRTIIARIEGCKDDIMNRMVRHIGYEMASAKLADAAKIKDVITGKAKCHPDDEFDIEVGRRLARDRALEEYHVRCLKAMKRVKHAMRNHGNILDEQINKEARICANRHSRQGNSDSK